MYCPFLCYQFDLVGTGSLCSITQAFISSVSKPLSGQSLCFHAALNHWGSLYGPTSSFAGPVGRVNRNQCNEGCFYFIMFFQWKQNVSLCQRRYSGPLGGCPVLASGQLFHPHLSRWQLYWLAFICQQCRCSLDSCGWFGTHYSVLCLRFLQQVLYFSSRRLVSQLSWRITLLQLSTLHALSVRRPLSLSLVVRTFRSLQNCLCPFWESAADHLLDAAVEIEHAALRPAVALRSCCKGTFTIVQGTLARSQGTREAAWEMS